MDPRANGSNQSQQELDWRFDVEASILGRILRDPNDNEWALERLSPTKFVFANLKQVARCICDLRDTGKRIHYRRVRRILNSQKTRENGFVKWCLDRAIPGFALNSWMDELEQLNEKQETNRNRTNRNVTQIPKQYRKG